LQRGCKSCAMEVSSHALVLHRVANVRFAVAIFTNLTRDHLDYHGTMDAYAESKYRLFSARGLQHAVINADDEWGRRFAGRLQSSGLDVITFGVEGVRREAREPPRLAASNIVLSEAGVRFHVTSEWGEGEVQAAVLGAFNVSNLLAVLGTLLAAGIAFDAARGAVSALQPVAGRLERVGGDKAPLVVIDYAHTPDALEKALEALRPTVAAGHRLYCVFGCGGDRDPGKRPLMGEAATRLADHVIVTSDNPRSEPPRAIIDAVMSGILDGEAEAIEDRQVAIFAALHQAQAGDVVLIAGKGHETYQEIAGHRHPFSDREVAKAALGEWQKSAR
jgi:UDP-N-acetylmuramoyl-L-alanyl-D-glutamate--2,6-diaminopimelate ligase